MDDDVFNIFLKDIFNPYYSTFIFKNNGVRYVLLGETHTNQSLDNTPGYHFATILKDVIDKCDVEMDLFVEDKFTRRLSYRFPSEEMEPDFSVLTPLNAVRYTAMQNRCDIVRRHVVDFRAFHQDYYELWNIDPHLNKVIGRLEQLNNILETRAGNIQNELIENVISTLKISSDEISSFWNQAMYQLSLINIESWMFEYDYLKKVMLRSLVDHPLELALTDILNTTISYIESRRDDLYSTKIQECVNRQDCSEHAQRIQGILRNNRVIITDFYTLVRMTKGMAMNGNKTGYTSLRVYYSGFNHTNNLQTWMRMLNFELIDVNIHEEHEYTSQVEDINSYIIWNNWQASHHELIKSGRMPVIPKMPPAMITRSRQLKQPKQILKHLSKHATKRR